MKKPFPSTVSDYPCKLTERFSSNRYDLTVCHGQRESLSSRPRHVYDRVRFGDHDRRNMGFHRIRTVFLLIEDETVFRREL